MLANGNPDDLIEELSHHQVGYREPLLLFHNSGNKWTERQRAEWAGLLKAALRKGFGDRRLR